uniref:Uncharacterized protein n=1 Tax=Schistosoma haematobium TaxID=6185 RepID=A0A095AZS9_SCHHA
MSKVPRLKLSKREKTQLSLIKSQNVTSSYLLLIERKYDRQFT